MIYSEKYETMPRQELAQMQIERLQTTLNRVYRNVAFYRAMFDKHDVNIEDIRSIADLRKIPLTTREDLRASYPYGMFAVPMRDIVRLHATSGTTGMPVAVGYTKNDILHWSELVARQLASAGLTEHDVVQVAFDYSLFTGGLGFHYGAERLGASVIPASSGRNVREQIAIMKDYKATALVCMPSFALAIGHALQDMKIRPDELCLRCGLFGAEPWSETLRTKLESMLHLKAHDTYGLSEVIGPGVAAECTERAGLHINEDHFIAEIIDPQTLQTLPPGREGELVFTTITKEGFPLIRYRTRDLATLMDGPCRCGRTFARISRLAGRSDDLIFIKGVKVFPSHVREAISDISELQPRCRIVVSTKDDIESVEVQVTLSQDTEALDELKNMEKLRGKVQQRLEPLLGLDARVIFVEPESLAGIGEGKKSVKVERL